MWGIIPAAGNGTRIQPLAFSKELLPVGHRADADGAERPKAVSEYLVERMVAGGATKICFVISPTKSDIVRYYGGGVAMNGRGVDTACPLIGADEPVLVGLPDTIWFPADALARLPDDQLSFLLFPVADPSLFDAVVLGADDQVEAIDVKQAVARSHWVWGAFKMPGRVLHELAALWREPGRGDEYWGTLVNAWLQRGNHAVGVRAGERYVDVGTLGGWREAVRLLGDQP